VQIHVKVFEKRKIHAKNVNMGVSEQNIPKVSIFFFSDGPIKVAHFFLKGKKLWDAPQLINVNHTRYPSACKSLLTNKVKNGNSSQAIRRDNMHPRYSPIAPLFAPYQLPK
jgi:hypothetical protein